MVARKKAVKAKPRRTQRVMKVTKQTMPAVDKAVRDYVALLKDPCNGPLVGPVGATANGYITRFETTLTINPTQPNWYLRWAPGAVTFTGTNGGGLAVNQAATMTGAFFDTPYTNSSAPGYAFLGNNCQTFRCLAACAQIRYTDTELNRKGVLGSTISASIRAPATIAEAFGVTVDRARVPDQALEVLWQPGDGDEYFVSRQTAELDDEARARKNAIMLAGSNCGAATVSVRLVVVYQWTPGNDDNIILPVPMPGTGITMARVIQIARQTGFLAGHLIKGYATGGLYGAARELASVVKPSIKSM